MQTKTHRSKKLKRPQAQEHKENYTKATIVKLLKTNDKILKAAREKTEKNFLKLHIGKQK